MYGSKLRNKVDCLLNQAEVRKLSITNNLFKWHLVYGSNHILRLDNSGYVYIFSILLENRKSRLRSYQAEVAQVLNIGENAIQAFCLGFSGLPIQELRLGWSIYVDEYLDYHTEGAYYNNLIFNHRSRKHG